MRLGLKISSALQRLAAAANFGFAIPGFAFAFPAGEDQFESKTRNRTIQFNTRMCTQQQAAGEKGFNSVYELERKSGSRASCSLLYAGKVAANAALYRQFE